MKLVSVSDYTHRWLERIKEAEKDEKTGLRPTFGMIILSALERKYKRKKKRSVTTRDPLERDNL
tara:strand:- start:4308 stop:4499 length:192 start_codon:yes stop_codon:yes gene_type:complete